MQDPNHQHRQLGQTGIQITPIGLGCWQFSNGKGVIGNYWTELAQQTMTGIVKAALDSGINWFDTAEIYGRGNSESALAHALTTLNIAPRSIRIATKWWPLWRTAGNIPRTIDQRLTKLNPYPIDLYQVHLPYGFSSVKAEMNQMADLVEAGKIRSIGISNFSARAMRTAVEVLAKRGHRLASNQVKYSLLHRKIESNGVLDFAREAGITIIAYSPLAQGLLTGKFHANPELIKKRRGPRKYSHNFKDSGLRESAPVITLLQEIGKKYEATPSQVALNWVINRAGETVVAIPGASSLRQAKENAHVLNFTLSTEEIDRLNRRSRRFKP